MKVRVINENLSCYNEEFKVTRLNFDMIIAQDNDEKVCFHKDDVKIISENKYEDIILKYPCIVKIKLGRGISLLFYTAIINCIEKVIKEKLEDINLLRDEFEVIKKGIWEKRLLLVVNEKFSMYISVIGRNYGHTFDVTIKDITLRDFIDDCCFEIEELKKEISEKETLISRYEKSIRDVFNNYGKLDTGSLLINAENNPSSKNYK